MPRRKKLTVNRLPITKARMNLGSVVRKTHSDKEYFIIEKDGIPVVGVMDIDEFEDYLETKKEQEDEEFQADIDEGYQEFLKGNLRTVDEFFKALEEESD